MISIKSAREIEFMKKAGDILARCFDTVERHIGAGVRTADLDKVAERFIKENGAEPSFKGVEGMVKGAPRYPANMCVSVNNEVIHGIPGSRVLCEGDIVSIDMGVLYMGYHSDMARTYGIGGISEEAKRLIEVAKECFIKGMNKAFPQNRVADISLAVQQCAENNTFSVVKDYVGHGIGKEMHEPPQVPNFVGPKKGSRLQSGMTLAIEPMINAGKDEVMVMPNKWTVCTRDGSLSAHYENTVLVCDNEPVILSKVW